MLLFLEWILECERVVGFRNAHEFVILSDALGAAERTGLDLAGAETDGEVRN